MRKKKNNFSGMTFIEILIGLTIFSVVAVSLYSTFFSSTSAWKKSEDLNRMYQEARWSMDTIAKELHNAVIFSYKNSYPNFKVFEGKADSISFLNEDDYGINRVLYFLEAKENGGGEIFLLKRQESSLIDSLQISVEEKSEEIFSSLVAKDGLKFSYAHGVVNGEDEEIEWKSDWEESENIPMGVKVELVLQNPGNPNVKTTFSKTVFIPMGVIGEIKE
ncbi:MAG: type II secretion system protein [Candidatus Omnitrophica bacterium]|nr:type II secretion system protein [Candidatus Omnitrophota bacterium]